MKSEKKKGLQHFKWFFETYTRYYEKKGIRETLVQMSLQNVKLSFQIIFILLQRKKFTKNKTAADLSTSSRVKFTKE